MTWHGDNRCAVQFRTLINKLSNNQNLCSKNHRRNVWNMHISLFLFLHFYCLIFPPKKLVLVSYELFSATTRLSWAIGSCNIPHRFRLMSVNLQDILWHGGHCVMLQVTSCCCDVSRITDVTVTNYWQYCFGMLQKWGELFTVVRSSTIVPQ